MQTRSKRDYQIVQLQYPSQGIETMFTLSLDAILHSDFEVCYALHEVLDEVLDLKLHESMYFTPNRDMDKSKAILLRIN
jgi:hypothetical protein